MKKIFSFIYEVLSGFVSIYVFVVIIVGIHEYGHYKEFVDLGIPLEEFSVGFGPKILQLDGPSGMAINFRLLPLGGYVAPTDEGAEKFLQTHAGDQIQVMGAGILATLVLATVMIWLVYGHAWYQKKVGFIYCVALIVQTPYILFMRCAAFICSFFTFNRIDFSQKYLVPIDNFDTSKRMNQFVSSSVYISMFNLLPVYPLDGQKIFVELLSYVHVTISPELTSNFSDTVFFLLMAVLYCAHNLNLTIIKSES